LDDLGEAASEAPLGSEEKLSPLGEEGSLVDISKLLLGESADGEGDQESAASEDDAGKQDDCGRMCDAGERRKCCEVALQPMKAAVPEYQAWMAARHAYQSYMDRYDVASASKAEFDQLHALHSKQELEKARWEDSDTKRSLTEHEQRCVAPQTSGSNGCVAGGAAGAAALRGRRNAQRVRRLKRMIQRVIMRVVRSQMTDTLIVSQVTRMNEAQWHLGNMTEAQNLADERVDTLENALKAAEDAPSSDATIASLQLEVASAAGSQAARGGARRG
jgi:hypothetical protein